MATEIISIAMGIPGPSGSGVTAAQWAALQAIVASASTGIVTVHATDTGALLVEKADGTDIFKVDTTTPGVTLTGDNSSMFLVEQADGDNIFQVSTSGLVVRVLASDLVIHADHPAADERIRFKSNGHFVSSGPSPSIATGAAAGTGPSASIAGTDRCGRIGITTGTGPTTGTLATITFAAGYSTADYMVNLTPADADSAAVSVARPFVSDTGRLTGSFTITAPAALAASTGYLWWYLVEGYEP